MTEDARRPLARVLVAAALLAPGAARALDVANPMASTSPTARTTEAFVTDLSAEDAPTRRFAGRVLSARLARADRRRHGDPDALATMDAQATWDALSRSIPDACTAALRHDEVVIACSGMLARLGEVDALPALRDARLRVEPRRLRRAVDDAIAALEATSATAPAATP